MLFLFRGFCYRFVIKYNEIGTRPDIEITHRNLLKIIERKIPNRTIDIHEIVKIANEITNEQLSFTTNRVSNNPNDLINLNLANCVGYSAMFNSIANHLISKNDLQSELKAEHKIGQLELFGINLHQFFDTPFFKNHDFNEITHMASGTTIFIDPSVSDYLLIKRIAKK